MAQITERTPMGTFTERNLRERTAELIRDAKQGQLSVITKEPLRRYAAGERCVGQFGTEIVRRRCAVVCSGGQTFGKWKVGLHLALRRTKKD